jgi:hypothetical protein
MPTSVVKGSRWWNRQHKIEVTVVEATQDIVTFNLKNKRARRSRNYILSNWTFTSHYQPITWTTEDIKKVA